MDFLQITLRLLHVVGGVFWVGALLFNALFLGPAVREAGPEGGKVMGIMMKNKLPVIMPLVGLMTILSGIWLYYRDSVGFSSAYMKTKIGMTFGFGGIMAISALVVGGAMLAPTLEKIGKIGMQMPTAAPADRERLGAELNALRGKAKFVGNLGAALGGLAAAAMAVARYMI